MLNENCDWEFHGGTAKRYFNYDGNNENDNQQGCNGIQESNKRPGVLSEAVMSYYRQVSNKLEDFVEEDDDPAAKEEFLKNVLSSLNDELIEVSQNQTVSRMLEVLFAHCQPHHLQPLFCRFCDNLAIVTFDRFASHVFQAFLQYVPAMYQEDIEEGWHEDTKIFKAAFERLCIFMESHIRDTMTDTYGSHVLRCLLEAMSGVTVKEDIVRSRGSLAHRNKGLAPQLIKTVSKFFIADYKPWFDKLTEKLIRLCNYDEHLSDPHYCPMLQTVLLILHKTSPDQYKELSDTILKKTCSSVNDQQNLPDTVSDRLPQVVQNEVGSYLIELLISLTPKEEFKNLYSTMFKGKIICFAVHPIANYVLQKVVETIADSSLFEDLLTEISQYMEDILALNHLGIVTKLAEACRRLGVRSRNFLEVLMTAFHCNEPASRQIKLVPLLASLQTFEVFYSTEQENQEPPEKKNSPKLLTSVNIHGSLLLQQLLKFRQPALVVSSLLELSNTELIGMFCDKCGSHVIDVFFESTTVMDKSKDQMIKKLMGCYINIACDRNGSRCLENVWKGISLRHKALIAEDLCKNEARLESDQWGKFLHRNFALVKFSGRKKEWLEFHGAETKKKQLLKDILQGQLNPKKKKAVVKSAGDKPQLDNVAVKDVTGTTTAKKNDVGVLSTKKAESVEPDKKESKAEKQRPLYPEDSLEQSSKVSVIGKNCNEPKTKKKKAEKSVEPSNEVICVEKPIIETKKDKRKFNEVEPCDASETKKNSDKIEKKKKKVQNNKLCEVAETEDTEMKTKKKKKGSENKSSEILETEKKKKKVQENVSSEFFEPEKKKKKIQENGSSKLLENDKKKKKKVQESESGVFQEIQKECEKTKMKKKKKKQDESFEQPSEVTENEYVCKYCKKSKKKKVKKSCGVLEGGSCDKVKRKKSVNIEASDEGAENNKVKKKKKVTEASEHTQEFQKTEEVKGEKLKKKRKRHKEEEATEKTKKRKTK